MKNNKPWIYLIGAGLIALLVKYSGSILHAGQLVFSILVPLLLGCAIAYILNILVVWIEKLPFLKKQTSPLFKRRRAVSILSSLLIVAAVILLLIKLILPQLAETLAVILSAIPPMFARLIDWLLSQDLPLPRVEEWLRSLQVDWPQLIQKIMAYLSSGVGSLFSSTLSILSSLGGIVMQTVVAFIFSLYLLAGKERLTQQFQSLGRVYLKEKTYQRLSYVLSVFHDTFTKFFVGQFTEAIIIGVLCAVGMWIFRFPYAAMIGTLIGATALLPVIGAYLGAFIGAFMILTVNPVQAVMFLVFIVVLQQLEGNLIYPRVVGSSVGLPGMWVLTAVTLGGGLGGIVGMLLAVPTAAALYRLIRANVRQRSARQKTDSTEALPPPQ